MIHCLFKMKYQTEKQLNKTQLERNAIQQTYYTEKMAITYLQAVLHRLKLRLYKYLSNLYHSTHFVGIAVPVCVWEREVVVVWRSLCAGRRVTSGEGAIPPFPVLPHRCLRRWANIPVRAAGFCIEICVVLLSTFQKKQVGCNNVRSGCVGEIKRLSVDCG